MSPPELDSCSSRSHPAAEEPNPRSFCVQPVIAALFVACHLRAVPLCAQHRMGCGDPSETDPASPGRIPASLPVLQASAGSGFPQLKALLILFPYLIRRIPSPAPRRPSRQLKIQAVRQQAITAHTKKSTAHAATQQKRPYSKGFLPFSRFQRARLPALTPSPFCLPYLHCPVSCDVLIKQLAQLGSPLKGDPHAGCSTSQQIRVKMDFAAQMIWAFLFRHERSKVCRSLGD